jgi:hypothetical protein
MYLHVEQTHATPNAMNNATKNLASTLQQNKEDGLLVNFTML